MRTMRMFRLTAAVAALALISATAATAAPAPDIDVKGDKELTERARTIDTTTAGQDTSRVTTRIVDQWKGTTFKFDPAGTPRELTAQDVQDLRAKRLGYGEISILLALTANQTDQTSAKSLSEILAMRQAGAGWGNLARDLGYRNLGSVIKSVRASERSMTRIAAERSPKPDKTSASAKPEKIDRPERPEKPEKPEKPERPERVEKPGR